MKTIVKAFISLPFDIALSGFLTMTIYNLTLHKVFSGLPEISIWHGILLSVALKGAQYKHEPQPEDIKIDFLYYFVSKSVLGGILIGIAYLVNLFIQ